MSGSNLGYSLRYGIGRQQRVWPRVRRREPRIGDGDDPRRHGGSTRVAMAGQERERPSGSGACTDPQGHPLQSLLRKTDDADPARHKG